MIRSVFKICVTTSYILLMFFNFLGSSVAFEEIIFPRAEILIDNSKHFNNINRNNYTANDSNLWTTENYREDEKSDWFLNIPLLPIAVATSNSIPEGPCKIQLRLYLNHLKNGTLWATEMFDSSAKYPFGIFNGLNRYLGSFDQCNRIKVSVPNSEGNRKFEEIRSKYCLVDITFQKKNEPTLSNGKYKFSLDPQDSAWEALKPNEDFRRYSRNILQMALCFPGKCNKEDIIAALEEPLEKFNSKYNFLIQATIHPEYCYATHEAPIFSNYDKAYCFLIFSIIALVIISTILDVKCIQQEKHCLSRKLLNCFSARRSYNAIFRIKYEQRGLDCLHLIRCIFACLTILSHRSLEIIQGGNITGLQFESAFSRPFLGLISNIDVSVDGFFAISGFVLSYYLLEHLEHSNGLKILPLIIKRYTRLMPSYMFVMFAYIFLIYHLGSGPFWESRIGIDRNSCSSNWWTNLFFIQNYVDEKNMCLSQAWTLAVDFQCYIIGLLLIGAFYKMPRKIGYILLGCTLIVTTAIPFYVTYKNDIDPFINMKLRERRVEISNYFLNYYIKTHMRLPGYLVGLIMGIIMHDCKFAAGYISKFWSQVLFILQVIVLPLFFQRLAIYFQNPNLKPSLFAKALYACLHRPIFALSISSIPLLITIGQGLDFYYELLTPRWVQPFTRLTYGMFLSHMIIQSYEFGTARTAFTYSFYNVIRNFIGDVTYVSFLSLLLAILIEEPFKNLANMLLMGRKPTKKISSCSSEKKVE